MAGKKGSSSKAGGNKRKQGDGGSSAGAAGSNKNNAGKGGEDETNPLRIVLGDKCYCHSFGVQRCLNCVPPPTDTTITTATSNAPVEKLSIKSTDQVVVFTDEVTKLASKIACQECRTAITSAIPQVQDVAVVYNTQRLLWTRASATETAAAAPQSTGKRSAGAAGGGGGAQNVFKLATQQLPTKAPMPSYLTNSTAPAKPMPAQQQQRAQEDKQKQGPPSPPPRPKDDDESPPPPSPPPPPLPPVSPIPFSQDQDAAAEAPDTLAADMRDMDFNVGPPGMPPLEDTPLPAFESPCKEAQERDKAGIQAMHRKPKHAFPYQELENKLSKTLRGIVDQMDRLYKKRNFASVYQICAFTSNETATISEREIPLSTFKLGVEESTRTSLFEDFMRAARELDVLRSLVWQELKVRAALGRTSMGEELYTLMTLVEGSATSLMTRSMSMVWEVLSVLNSERENLHTLLEPDDLKRKALDDNDRDAVLLAAHIAYFTTLDKLSLHMIQSFDELNDLLAYLSPLYMQDFELEAELEAKMYFALPEQKLGATATFETSVRHLLGCVESFLVSDLNDPALNDRFSRNPHKFSMFFMLQARLTKLYDKEAQQQQQQSQSLFDPQLTAVITAAVSKGKKPPPPPAEKASPYYSLHPVWNAVVTKLNAAMRAYLTHTNSEIVRVDSQLDMVDAEKAENFMQFKNPQLRAAMSELFYLIDFERSPMFVTKDDKTTITANIELTLREEYVAANPTYFVALVTMGIKMCESLLQDHTEIAKLLLDAKQPVKPTLQWKECADLITQTYFPLRLESKTQLLLCIAALLREARGTRCTECGVLGAQRIMAKILVEKVRTLIAAKSLLQGEVEEEEKNKKRNELKEKAALKAKQERERKEEETRLAKLAEEEAERKRKEEEEQARNARLAAIEEVRKAEALQARKLMDAEELRIKQLRLEQKKKAKQAEIVYWDCPFCTIRNSHRRDSKASNCTMCGLNKDAPPIVDESTQEAATDAAASSVAADVDSSTLASKRVIPVGLTNATGENSCFLNSALQCLFHIRSVAMEILQAEHECKDENCFQCCLLQTFQMLYSSSEPVSSVEIRNALAKLGFVMGEKADSVEALMVMLEQIDRLFPGLVGCKVVWGVECPVCRDKLEKSKLKVKHDVLDFYAKYGMMPRRAQPFTTYIHDASATLIAGFATGDNGGVSTFYEKVSVASTEEYVSCPVCDTPQLEPERRLVETPKLFVIGIAWSSANSPREEIKAVLQAISLHLDVTQIVGDTVGDNVPLQVLASLKSLTCYYGKHCACFCLVGDSWYLIDDFTVKSLGSTWVECAKYIYNCNYQPVSLFYEVDPALKESQCEFQGVPFPHLQM